MQAVILCAGKGERLRPLTNEIPKPLIPIGQKPILEYIFLSLPEEIEKVILVIKKKNEQIFRNFLMSRNFKPEINLVFQSEEKNGTFYALEAARGKIESEDKFLVLNGDDIFLKDDLTRMIALPAPVYGISYKKLDRRYRTCDLDLVNKKILSFRPQHEDEEGVEIPCFSGAFVLAQEFWSYKPISCGNGEVGIPHTLFAHAREVYFYPLSEWFQINNIEDIKLAQKKLVSSFS